MKKIELMLIGLFLVFIIACFAGCTSSTSKQGNVVMGNFTQEVTPLPEPTLDEPADMQEKIVFLTHSIGKSKPDFKTENGTILLNKTNAGFYILSSGEEADGKEYVTGEIRNDNPFPVNVRVKVDFIDAHNDKIGGGSDTIKNLETGQSATFKVYAVNLTWTIYDRTEWEKSYYSWEVYIDDVSRFTPTPTTSEGVTIATSEIALGDDGAYYLMGTVRNENPYPVSLSIKGQFMDSSHVVLDDGLNPIDNLNPDQVSQFKIPSIDIKNNNSTVAYWRVWIDDVSRVCGGCPPGELVNDKCECKPSCNGKICKDNESCCNGNCLSCPRGESLGPDCWCYPLCGNEICRNDETCCKGRCLKCNPGYGLGPDCRCYPLCGGQVCMDSCCNGKCLSCNEGYTLGSDCMCHKTCPNGGYCEKGYCCGYDRCCGVT